MSLDHQLAWRCPHITIEEVVPLAQDRRSLLTRQAAASANLVRLWANDEVLIPQGGLKTVAQIKSTISGPFDLVQGLDQLTLSNPQGTFTVAFNITGSSRIGAPAIAKEVLRQGITEVLVEAVGGHLVISDTTAVGTESFIRVGGSAAASLGFGDLSWGNDRQVAGRGKDLYPGWSLHTRPDDIHNRFPKFDLPVRSNPVFKVTYSAPPTRCLRCGGTLVENDFRFDTAGQSILIGNENLLYQACLKILLTVRGSNPYHTWYGTTITSRIGAKAVGAVAAQIQEDVRLALKRLQSLQQAQGRFQQMTLKEQLYQVLHVQVRPHVEDPTIFLIDVVVQNASAEPVSLSVVFTTPGVVALMGSNGLRLGTQAVGLGDDSIF